MNLPDLKIAGHQWKTLFPYRFREREDISGQSDKALFEIRVSDIDLCGNKKPNTATIRTYLHEIIHAIDSFYCMDMLGKEIDKEGLVEALAVGLTQVLLDNDLINKDVFNI